MNSFFTDFFIFPGIANDFIPQNPLPFKELVFIVSPVTWCCPNLFIFQYKLQDANWSTVKYIFTSLIKWAQFFAHSIKLVDNSLDVNVR